MLEIGGRKIGGDHFALIAGPCTVESRDQTADRRRRGARRRRDDAPRRRLQAAHEPVRLPGPGPGGPAAARRGQGAHRPADRHRADGRPRPRAGRSRSPTSSRSARATCRTTRCSPRSAAPACPVLLKRGLSATLEELLMAAEYILKEGNETVMLCERGIRTFETAYRFTLDLTAIPVLKELTHLPVIVDPSHAAGRRDLVEPLSRWPPRPRAPTASSSRCTPTPSRRSATGRSSSAAEDFAALRRPGRAAAAAVAGKAVAACRRLIVAVVGVGLDRGARSASPRASAWARRVRGVDPRADVALARGAVDSAHDDLADALDGADAAFVAAPVDALVDTVRGRPRRGARRAASSPTSARRSARSPTPAATRASSAAIRWRAPRSAASSTPAPTSSTAPPGT